MAPVLVWRIFYTVSNLTQSFVLPPLFNLHLYQVRPHVPVGVFFHSRCVASIRRPFPIQPFSGRRRFSACHRCQMRRCVSIWRSFQSGAKFQRRAALRRRFPIYRRFSMRNCFSTRRRFQSGANLQRGSNPAPIFIWAFIFFSTGAVLDSALHA